MVARRALSIGLLAPLAAAASSSQEIGRTRKRFKEVAASLYTWDMSAESIESILGTLRETAQVNSIYFMAMMHGEERPLTDLYFPRSLQPTKTLVAEDARAYWRPSPEFPERAQRFAMSAFLYGPSACRCCPCRRADRRFTIRRSADRYSAELQLRSFARQLEARAATHFSDGPIGVDDGVRRTLEMVVAATVE